MLNEKEDYALRILNKVVDNINITAKEKVSLCDEFVNQIRSERKENG